MKILLVQDYLRSGGTERQTILLANAFAARGHSVTLLTFRPGGALASTVAPSVERHSLQSHDTGLDWFAPGILDFTRAQHPAIALCLGRMANIYAGSIQGVLEHLRPPGAAVATMRTGKKLPWLFRRSLRQVAAVVANSHDAKSTLVDIYNIPETRISVIHNSLVFPNTATARDPELRARHGATPETTVLLSVAMFRPEKHQRTLIEIVRGLPPSANWQLWLAGDGPTRPDCEKYTRTSGLADRVRFLGFQRDPTALYTAADLAVHTSDRESLSNFLIEAQSHGLPAIAFAAQGITECFLPDDTGFALPAGDQEGFRRELLQLMNDPTKIRQARSERARAFARVAFDPARQVSAYVDLFVKLVGREPL